MADNVIEFSIRAKDEFSGVFGAFGKSLSLKVAAAAVATGAAFVGMVKAISEFEVKIGDAARLAGLTSEAMSGLAHAAELSNSSIEGVSNGLKFMQRSMAEANQGNVQAMRAFQDLGFATKDATGKTKDANAALAELADRFGQIQDPVEKTRLGLQLFGRGWSDIEKVMADGSEGLRRMAEDAQYLGVVLSGQTVANAKAFDDQTNRLTQSIKGVSAAIANEWIPILTGMTRALANQIAEWREPIREFAAQALDAILTAFVAVKQFVSGVYNFIVKSFSSAEGFDNFLENAKRAFIYLLQVAGLALKSLAMAMIGAFKLIWETFVEIGKWAWKSVLDFFRGTDAAGTLGELLFERIPDATRETLDEIKGVFGELAPEWAEMGRRGAEGMAEAFGLSSESIKAEVDALKQKFTEYGEVRKQVETETANVSIEQAYKNFLAQQQLLQEQANAHIFFAQTLHETWTATWDLIAARALNTSQQVSLLIQQTYDQVTAGIGNAVARAIVLGESMSDSLKKLAQQVLVAVIQMLVQMGVQRLIFAMLNIKSSAAEASANLSRGFAETFVNSFASAAAIPVYGWAIAPHVATANLGLAMAGASGAMAAGAGMGQAVGVAGVAHGGLTDVPREGTFLLDEGERVLSPGQNKDLTSFLAEDTGGMTVENLTLNVNITGSDFERMSASDIERLVGGKIYEAMNRLDRKGLRPDFVNRQRMR